MSELQHLTPPVSPVCELQQLPPPISLVSELQELPPLEPPVSELQRLPTPEPPVSELQPPSLPRILAVLPSPRAPSLIGLRVILPRHHALSDYILCANLCHAIVLHARLTPYVTTLSSFTFIL